MLNIQKKQKEVFCDSAENEFETRKEAFESEFDIQINKLVKPYEDKLDYEERIDIPSFLKENASSIRALLLELIEFKS